ncbi:MULTISPECIES: helix-turn-helix domain-containing protein [Rhodobacterales]|jgi:transcriptional regulator with XRE-family HTH domain|uniref:Helix-turn-helix domain-containing protein n=1 Tax=Phaeobacter gallaeciensis TaxID=60890 RepID=A0ABD4X7Z9_9RHOB|nr:helix-turn-helix domain-containing protein [Phaeobacter gallaeciensis]MDF1771026.1 helix-turn-helix domain-containing protein [Pseudophaeobacter sp. bin_em_oilr2.035]MDE4098717.1 helix-turn-helix domain-containing protein [Phaeobacter gallaeciensis]MDE4107526.1 helix-turn-helix domain-containing protein [Phaeobacter gallaeciensis]MDE4111980.1 helix-turn-helix domain-containing protein [Phaeobacter gallaeciensis]MDE4116452.1 helix-turn-helix domain-containing protein [Phaeobacter gallaeciens
MANDTTDWFGPEAATFGDRVAAAREAAGMTQGQLSRRLGVKKSTLSGWEQDLSEPRANKLSMMSGLLNVSMTWLLTGEGDGMPEPGELELEAGDFSSVLSELRELRAELRAGSDRAARLEKKLRNLLQNAAQ